MAADYEAFEAFTGAVEGIPLYARAVEPAETIPVQVLTHEGTWFSGTVTAGHALPPAGTLGLYADLSLVPMPWLALPHWLVDQIRGPSFGLPSTGLRIRRGPLRAHRSNYRYGGRGTVQASSAGR
jgi:hypothetical protein